MKQQKVLLAVVSIHGPLGYEPNTLPLRQRALRDGERKLQFINLFCNLHQATSLKVKVGQSRPACHVPGTIVYPRYCLLFSRRQSLQHMPSQHSGSSASSSDVVVVSVTL